MRFFAGDHYTFLSLALHFVSKKPLNMCNDIRVTLCTCEWEWHSDSGFVHLAPCLSLCQSLIVSIKDMKQGHPPGAARGECDVKKTGAAQVVLLKREENSRCVANNLVFAFVKRWQSQLCEKPIDKANGVKSCARANTCKTTPVNENKILAAYTPRNWRSRPEKAPRP
jgi:hypothetical protein